MVKCTESPGSFGNQWEDKGTYLERNTGPGLITSIEQEVTSPPTISSVFYGYNIF